MDYTIRRGDTLWALAQRFHTTVAKLAQENGIKNPDLIFTGAHLRVPGGSDSFGPRPAPAPSPDDGFQPSPGAGGSDAYAIARAQLGKNAGSLKLEHSAVGNAMEDWVPNNVNCASFVSGCLQAAGQISHRDYSASSMGLQAKLDQNSNFRRVSLANAKPGDVVTFSTGGGGHHTVMFAGWKDGKPQFIGSNNVNADGTQRITQGGMNYTVLSVHHYVG